MSRSTADTQLLARTEAFAREVVAPGAARWEAERRIAREAIEAAAGLGLTGIEVPTEWGGLGLGFGVKAQIAQVLGAADFGFTMSLDQHPQRGREAGARSAAGHCAALSCPSLLAGRRLGCTALTEARRGSDFAAIQTLAVRTPQGWRIDGAKAWITNAAEADAIVLYAQTEAGSGARGIACFVVDGRRDGFVREPAYALAGQHAIGTGGFPARRLRGAGRRNAAAARAGLQGGAAVDQRRAQLYRRDVQRHGRRSAARGAGLRRNAPQLWPRTGRPPGLALAAGRGRHRTGRRPADGGRGGRR